MTTPLPEPESCLPDARLDEGLAEQWADSELFPGSEPVPSSSSRLLGMNGSGLDHLGTSGPDLNLDVGVKLDSGAGGIAAAGTLGMGLIDRPVGWVALAGFMGTGKSRIGWELSRALALHFVDTDKLITRVVGKSIPEVFASEGESYFRACEGEVVRRVTRLDYAVVSLGGGTFVHEDNRRILLERGPVVVLWATPETILARTRHSDRPLLQASDPLARIAALMSEREGAYRQGTIHVNSDGRPSEEIVEEIIERLWQYQEQTIYEPALGGPPEVGGERAAD
ncbi:shikimate kinase [Deinococcus sp.]|uniref:shikimate kinase n=1 Tax=Deinococcus sp. TaxID=47478 RepID=UPI003CC5F8FF